MTDIDANQPHQRAQQGTIIVEDETLREGFTQIPNGILRRQDLSPGAKLTYMVILSYAWGRGSAFPGQETLAADMGVTTRSVITYLKQLQETGLLKVTRRGLGQTNLYTLPKIAPSTTGTRRSRSEKSSLLEVKKATAPEVKDFQPEKDPATKKTKIENLEASKTRMVAPEGIERSAHTAGTADENDQVRDAASATTGFETIGVTLKRRRARRNADEYDEARQRILEYVADFARDFANRAPLKSSTSRAVNLYREAGVELDVFIEAMYRSRAIVRERTATIRGSAETGTGPVPTKNKMAYWFSVLEDVLGLKDSDDQPPATH